jgi:hypothetical protein
MNLTETNNNIIVTSSYMHQLIHRTQQFRLSVPGSIDYTYLHISVLKTNQIPAK